MKSYLSLIPISAKVHRRQNRMTLLCIMFAVFMVTAVFSMAEMGTRMELNRLSEKHGGISLAEIVSSEMGQMLFATAAFLFILVLIAGVLMISGSINSSIAQRTKFFGMMRCIGMSKQQIIRFVRLEALNWCKTAIPIGLGMGIVTTWGLCAILRFIVGEEFSQIPLFGISAPGILCGILVGVITVLIAAGAPARRASKVSAIAAISGNSDNQRTIHTSKGIGHNRIETVLGRNHAVSVKKNLTLLTGSFALSIILFLSFSVIIQVVNYIMPQSAATSDIDIVCQNGTESFPQERFETIRQMDGVKEIYGRRSAFDIPAELDRAVACSDTVDVISYDNFDLQCLKKDGALKWGSHLSKVYGDSQYVLATSDSDSDWEIGDTIQMGDESLTIAGLLKNDPFTEDGMTNGKITLITSGETYMRLTGDTAYDLVMIQLTDRATEADVEAIRAAAGAGYDVLDKREDQTGGTYLAFVVCVYSFLGIIALVTVLNIVNSISMSVSARIKQYGAMRAVGMDDRQITRMIAVEAATYAGVGCVIGCVIGLVVNKLLYSILITGHFPYAVWHLPIGALIIILLFVAGATGMAVYAPAKRIRRMSITETINEL